MAGYFGYFKVAPNKQPNYRYANPPDVHFFESIPVYSSGSIVPNLPSTITLGVPTVPPAQPRPGTNPDTGEFNDSNCAFPQVYDNVEIRCKELYTGEAIKFNCNSIDPYNRLGTARDVSARPNPVNVTVGGGAPINNLRFYSYGSGNTPGNKQYSFSQVVRRLKDIGILERGVGWVPPVPAANPWSA